MGCNNTHCEGKGPENPGVVAPLFDAGCRGNRRYDTFGWFGGMLWGTRRETQRRLNFGAVSLSQNLYKSYCYLSGLANPISLGVGFFVRGTPAGRTSEPFDESSARIFVRGDPGTSNFRAI